MKSEIRLKNVNWHPVFFFSFLFLNYLDIWHANKLMASPGPNWFIHI